MKINFKLIAITILIDTIAVGLIVFTDIYWPSKVVIAGVASGIAVFAKKKSKEL